AFQETVFRQGDKVLHLVNEAALDVFNGDIGEITDLVPDKYTESKQDEIVMSFDGNEVIYPRGEWYKITLAYAMSIHKSQGSEFPSVIVPMVSSYSRMLERNLLYTAITRAKQSLILLGDSRSFQTAVARQGANRKTYLVERFGIEVPEAEVHGDQAAEIVEPSVVVEEVVPENVTAPESYILTKDNVTTIDPMIGLTEQDFELFFGQP
ncbi:MAG: ATP-binding domain-containing protein, partial [Lactococcus chungangensis]|nr:ATP-binding domain-containing protein [Lactococcus chungangensis]